MSRQPRAGGRYIRPLLNDGSELTEESGRGVFTLAAGTTYHFVIGGNDAPFVGVHLTGYDAAMILTSATIRDCIHGELDVPNHSVVAGEWPPEDPTTAFVSTEGAGWVDTNGVVAVAGGAVGGALWHVAETAAFRTRLTVVVGATGGRVRVSGHGKM